MRNVEFELDRDIVEEGVWYSRFWHANSLLALTFGIPRIPCDFSIGKYGAGETLPSVPPMSGGKTAPKFYLTHLYVARDATFLRQINYFPEWKLHERLIFEAESNSADVKLGV